MTSRFLGGVEDAVSRPDNARTPHQIRSMNCAFHRILDSAYAGWVDAYPQADMPRLLWMSRPHEKADDPYAILDPLDHAPRPSAKQGDVEVYADGEALITYTDDTPSIMIPVTELQGSIPGSASRVLILDRDALAEGILHYGDALRRRVVKHRSLTLSDLMDRDWDQIPPGEFDPEMGAAVVMCAALGTPLARD